MEFVLFAAGRDEEDIVHNQRDETERAGLGIVAPDEIETEGLLDVSG
jgi:hypothetical protein